MLILAAWQGLQNDSISSGNTRLLMIFVGMVALCMLAQTIVVIAMAIGAKKAQERVALIAEQLRGRSEPILDAAETLLKDSVPKVKVITENLVETSRIVREQAEKLNSTLSDANTRTKAQVARVDGMVSSALSATGSVAEMIHKGIKTPVVEIAGVVNGLKAGLDVLLSKSGFGSRKGRPVTAHESDRAGI
jgi:hypothetical protein